MKFFFINQNYINESSTILKIEFSNKEEIIIKLENKNNIQKTFEINQLIWSLNLKNIVK